LYNIHSHLYIDFYNGLLLHAMSTVTRCNLVELLTATCEIKWKCYE